MPKSRRRRKPRSHSQTRRPPSLPPELGPMLKADELEARADAAGALRVVEGMPVDTFGRSFWRPERVRRLRQLVALGDSAPAWVWGRWVVAQAAQSTPQNSHRAIEVAVQTRGGSSTLWGVDEMDAQCKVIDHDWVYRQLVLHEYGGLASFVRRRASSALLSRARGVEAWVGAAMGAYELVDEAPDELTWRDLGTERLFGTVNLGGAALCAIGAHVIGRVVESEGSAVFESPPLIVPPDVAEAVSVSPSDWIGALAEECRGPYGPLLGELVAKVHHFDLLCDMPCSMRRQLMQPLDDALRADQLGSGGNGVQYDVALVLAALADGLDLEDRGVPAAPHVAAALLEPGTVEALDGLLVPSDAGALRWLGGVLAQPAGVVCERLAASLSSAA
jgi:hypothetical protein